MFVLFIKAAVITYYVRLIDTLDNIVCRIVIHPKVIASKHLIYIDWIKYGLLFINMQFTVSNDNNN